MEIEPGTVVASRYRVLRQLGRGGMGEVFAAENIRTGRTVAVKVLRADSKQKASAVERFRREARAAGAISSDYVTQVLDVEDDAEHGIVIVFELLEGESLIDRLKRTGPMTFDELFPIVEQVWMGLADAHKSGVVHRDLKPSNVFLERRPDGTVRVKILDFGISKIPREVGGETLTEMGQSLGTFSFMPPEQIGKAKTVDHRADIYAAATLIYQAMSGQLPYAAKNILQMVDLKTKSEPRQLGSVLDGPVDPRLESFLAKGLARDPNNRFQSATEALDTWRVMKRAAAGPAARGSAANARGGVNATMASPGSHAPFTSSGSSTGSSSSQIQVPTNLLGGGPAVTGSTSQGRAPATVMLADPRSHNVSPMPSPQPVYGHQQSGPQPVPTQGKLGGTVAMSPNAFPAQGGPAYAGAAAPTGAKPSINVPVVNDTTSEGGGDHVATIAMPVRSVAQSMAQAAQAKGAPAPSGIPRVHDDTSERGQMGTQLMSHASLRQAGANIPQAQTRQDAIAANLAASQHHGSGSHPRISQAALTPMPGSASYSGSQPAVSSQPLAQTQADSGQASGEGADLTTVYRRDKDGPPPVQVPVTAPAKSSRIGLFIGVIAFALVGFAIAALVLKYVRTGTFFW